MEVLDGLGLAVGIGLELRFGPARQRSASVLRLSSIAVGGNAISTLGLARRHSCIASDRNVAMRSLLAPRLLNCFSHMSLNRASTLRLTSSWSSKMANER